MVVLNMVARDCYYINPFHLRCSFNYLQSVFTLAHLILKTICEEVGKSSLLGSVVPCISLLVKNTTEWLKEK